MLLWSAVWPLLFGVVTTRLVNKILYEICNTYVDFNLCAIYTTTPFCIIVKISYHHPFGTHNHHVDYSAAHFKNRLKVYNKTKAEEKYQNIFKSINII